MKRTIALFALIFLFGACAIDEHVEIIGGISYPREVSARIEECSLVGETRAYVDQTCKVLWHNDDRISLFNKYTYNKEYSFSGETGSNAGIFIEVNTGAVVTGNELDNVYAIYPYRESNTISNEGVISLILPAEQLYSVDSFGKEANTMVSVTANTELLFKNLCGFLILKLYGEDVSVSSITLQGNNNEPLAGDVDVTSGVGLSPTFSFKPEGQSASITIVCDTPVKLGTNAEDATLFWFVVPPTTFENGFTITVKDTDGKSFSKSTSTSATVSRNATYRMGALDVVFPDPQPNNIIYYTTSDGSLLYYTSNYSNTEVFGANIISNEYIDGVGIMTFDGPVTKIACKGAFYNDRLKTISLPGSVEDIAPGAFYSCPNMTRFEGKFSCADGKCLVKSGHLISAAISGETKFETPEGISVIEPYALNSNQDIRTLIISEGVETVGDHAFEYCGNLMNVKFPQTLKSLGYRCLGATDVQSLMLPSGLQSIDDLNNSFKALDINNPNPASISENAFGKNMYTPATYPIYVPKGTLKQFASAWPDYADRLREKGDKPLNEFRYTTTDGVMVSIGGYAGDNNRWEKRECIESHTYGRIVFYAPITTIPSDTFLRANNLKTISIPDAVVNLGSNSFDQCGSLESIEFGKYTEELGWYCFGNCTSLETVVIPNSVKHLYYTFVDCTNLSSVTLPNNLVLLGSRSDKDWKPGYEGSVFEGCTALEHIDLPETLTYIGGYCFSRTGLKSIDIPSTVSSIGKSAFYNCLNLTELTIPEGVTEIALCSGCTNLTSVTIPSTVTTIGDNAFSRCESLQSIELPEALTSIGSLAFCECKSLTEFTIPRNVKSIGDQALWNCSGLRVIYVKPIPDNPTWGTGGTTLGRSAFFNTNNCPISIPTPSLDYYLYADNWSDYASRMDYFDDIDWRIGGNPYPGQGVHIMAMKYVEVKAGQTVTAQVFLWDGGESAISWQTYDYPTYINGVDEGTLDDIVSHTYEHDYSGFIYAWNIVGRYSSADGMSIDIISIK